MSSSPAATERHHALDSLRGTLMLLGVVLHAALFFAKGGGMAAWPLREGAGHGAFNLLIGWIHLFRMPAFFVLAGFFGALLWHRLGSGGFLRHRARRILLPLAAAWAVLGPLVAALAAGLAGARGQDVSRVAELAWLHLISGAWLAKFNLIHLWFLWYLFLLCAGAWCVLSLAAHIPAGARDRLAGRIADALVSRYNLAILIVLTALTLRPMRTAAIATGTSVWPKWSILAAYAVFFAAGWIWHRRSEYLATLARGYGWRLGAGALFGLVATLFNFGTIASRQKPPAALLVVTAAGCWWCILGLIGFFQRHFAKPDPLVRYLSDSSYWVYLVHIPVLLALAPLLRFVPAGAGIKYLLLVAAASLICIASYEVCVRRTAVGVFLNGGRRSAQPASALA